MRQVILLWFGYSLLTFFPGVAQAQRGLAPASVGTYKPLSGFSGLFDSFAPDENSLVVSGMGLTSLGGGLMPNLQIEYGLSSQFSIGTSALSLLSLSGVPAFAGKGRYRLAVTPRLHTALTLYGFYFKLADTENSDDSSAETNNSVFEFLGYMSTANVTFFVSDHFWLGGTLANLWFRGEVSSYLGVGRVLLSSFFTGINGQVFFSKYFGPRVLLLLPVHTETSTDEGSVSFSAQRSAVPLIYHAQIDSRLGDNWLASIGYFDAAILSLSGFTFELARRW